MGLLTCLFAGALLLCAAVAGVAQTEAPVKTQAETEAVPAPPPPSPAAWGLGPVNVSGLVDGYYSLGFNHPAGNVSVLRNFDDKANQPELNMAMLTLDVAPKPVGAHVDVGFGRVFDMISATEKDVTPMRFFKQAYISLKPGSWKGVQLDFGRFATSAGAEVIDSAGNFNYSRSLLFAWCEPYYHFGMRASAPIGKEFTAGLQWVAGWNNIVTGSTYRTVGVTSTWTKSKFAWSNTFYGGPDENKANRGTRSLYDTVLLLTPNSKASFYINFDYFHNSPKYTSAYRVYGLAGAAKIQVTRKFYMSPRLEFMNDGDGGATGTAQKVKEFTLTGQYAVMNRLLGFLEYRHDWSDQPFFNRGNELGNWRRQPTVLVGMVAIIGPKR